MISAEMLVEMCQALTRLPIQTNSSYVENLTHVVSVVNETANLSEFEELIIEQVLLTQLNKRVRVEDYLGKNADVLLSPVVRPTFIVGLPRTGTTLLSQLLSLDPQRRSLLNWEIDSPLPPPTSASLKSDPRCTTRKRVQEIIVKYKPSRAAIHWEFADDPTECTQVLGQDFIVGLLELAIRVPGYMKQSGTLDTTSSYEYHKRFLQLAQSRAPGTWNLKSPVHAYNLKALLKVYPDARLICTHRDPYRMLASVCSLMRSLGQRFLDFDPLRFKNDFVDMFLRHMSKLMTDIAELPSNTIYHVQYTDLTSDPISEVKKLYTWLNSDFNMELQSKMTTHLSNNRQFKFGRHTYDLKEFGISEAEVRHLFEEYSNRFAVQREKSSLPVERTNIQ